ncbi:MAG: sensor domain-containing diguanylate cyclase [bacterium]
MTKEEILEQALRYANSNHPCEEILAYILDRIEKVFNCQSAAIMTINEAKGEFRVKSERGLPWDFVKYGHLKIDEGVFKRVIGKGETCLLTERDSELEDIKGRFENGFNTFLAAPVATAGRPIGLMCMGSQAKAAFDPEDETIFSSLAELVGLVIERGQLYDRIKEIEPFDKVAHLKRFQFLYQDLEQDIQISIDRRQPLALLFLEIDRFKSYMGMYGFEKGKELLVEIGGVIKQSTMGIVTHYRWEQFGILLPEEGPAKAKETAEFIRQKIEEFEPEGKEVPITASIGLTAFEAAAPSAPEMVCQAEEALWEAHVQGGNKVVSFAEIVK